jgi:hypothetical protein
MTSCEGVVLPREQGANVFHGPRGEIDRSVMMDGMENVEPGEAITSAEATCKSLLSCFARLSIKESSIK